VIFLSNTIIYPNSFAASFSDELIEAFVFVLDSSLCLRKRKMSPTGLAIYRGLSDFLILFMISNSNSHC
jgi:hypothetical protein